MENKLNILWTSSDPEVAHNMVFMYATNAKLNNWFEEVNLIIWGPSAKLVANDEGIKERIKLAKHAGVNVEACIACASNYNVVEELKAQNITLRGMGVPLTEIIKSGGKLITI